MFKFDENETEITIETCMFEGDSLPCYGKIPAKDISQTGLLGSAVTKNSPIACPRCKGNYMYICRDYGKFAVFCGDDKCMTLDSNASKKKDTNKWLRKKGI